MCRLGGERISEGECLRCTEVGAIARCLSLPAVPYGAGTKGPHSKEDGERNTSFLLQSELSPPMGGNKDYPFYGSPHDRIDGIGDGGVQRRAGSRAATSTEGSLGLNTTCMH